MIPPECDLIEIALHVFLAQPVEDPKLGSFKLGVKGFGGTIVNLTAGELLLAVVYI